MELPRGEKLSKVFFLFLDRIECTACASLYYSIVACSACSCSLARLGRHVRRAPEVEAGVTFGTQKSVHRATMVRGQKTRPRIRWFGKSKERMIPKFKFFLTIQASLVTLAIQPHSFLRTPFRVRPERLLSHVHHSMCTGVHAGYVRGGFGQIS